MWLARTGTFVLLIGLWAVPDYASAQEFGGGVERSRSLRYDAIAASTAAAADWASTYHALKYYNVRETNPLLRGLDDSPGRMITLGAAIDAGAISAWTMTVGREHPKIATVGLWAMTAFRAYLTVHNMRNERRASRR
jgi:hypothetical protein